MSAKLTAFGAVYPTECFNKTLNIDVGFKTISIAVPFVGDNVFARDCTYFASNDIFAYMENDSIKIVIRPDGSVSAYTKDDILMLNTHIDLPNFDDYYTHQERCLVRIAGSQDEYMSTLYVDMEKSEAILNISTNCRNIKFPGGANVSAFKFNLKENQGFFKDMFDALRFNPYMILEVGEDGKLLQLRKIGEGESYILKGSWIYPTGKIVIY